MKIAVQGLKLDGSNWIFSYRHGGKARRMKLGAAPLLVSADARKAASILAGQVACGRDPERKAAQIMQNCIKAPIRDTIEKVAAAYLKHANARIRLSTWTETKRVFDREVLPAWRGRRLSEITKADVRKLIEGVAKRAPVGANRLLASLKTFFDFAVEQDLISASPAAAIRPPAPEKPRAPVLGGLLWALAPMAMASGFWRLPARGEAKFSG